MTNTNHTDRDEALMPPEDDMLCINCQFGEWRHRKDNHPCKNFDNGLAKSSPTKSSGELEDLQRQIRQYIEEIDQQWGYTIEDAVGNITQLFATQTAKLQAEEIEFLQEIRSRIPMAKTHDLQYKALHERIDSRQKFLEKCLEKEYGVEGDE